MTEVVRLWYLLDNGPTLPCSIEIGLDKLVCDLKEIVTSKNYICDFEADDIVLYKSSAFQANLMLCSSNHAS